MPWRLYGGLLEVGLSRIRWLLFSGIHFVAWAVTFPSLVIAELRSLIVAHVVAFEVLAALGCRNSKPADSG